MSTIGVASCTVTCRSLRNTVDEWCYYAGIAAGFPAGFPWALEPPQVLKQDRQVHRFCRANASTQGGNDGTCILKTSTMILALHKKTLRFFKHQLATAIVEEPM